MSVRWPRHLTPTHLSHILRKQKNPLKALEIFNKAKSWYPNYRHNGPVYATMISILGNSGKMTGMKQVIEQMKDDSCECRDKVFASVIRTFHKSGLLDDAIFLFKDLPHFNCVNWTLSFNTLMEILVKESRLDDACHIFLENSHGWEVKSRTHSLNLLLHALCQINRSDLALQVFQEMNCLCCYPNRETYKILMRGLCVDGRLNEATHLLYSMFWRISQKGGGRDIVVYRTLLDALCDNGHVQEASEILSKVLKKGLKAPNRYFNQLNLSQFHNGMSIENSKNLINEALIKRGVSSSGSFISMAVDLYSEDRISEANKVLTEMQNRGYRPSLLIYEAMLAAFCRKGMVDEAIHVLEREIKDGNCVPTVRLYNIVIEELCRERKFSFAVDYLKKMSRQVGCVPDKETYTILVNGLCHDGRYIEASQTLEAMLVNLFWPEDTTYNMLIRGLCLIGRPYEAVMWLEEMAVQAKTPEPSVWESLVVCVCTDTQASNHLADALNAIL